ncbi:MAG: GNAT family N-acetyltransferase [Hydrogenophaga sp.]|uniref:GNAT family N-acetyltransferase n=1 Tax=Hydrogenophaga sp. TaxID=1904254 RepID=UPI003D9BB0B3
MSFASRPATTSDTLTLSALATQVFLDTYATRGISSELAREAATVYAPAVFGQRLRDASVELWLATSGGHAVGFVDVAFATACPVPGVGGAEVFRLYVQRPFLRQGVGRALLAEAERIACGRGAGDVWLTAWVGNERALAFYRAQGYRDVGATEYVIEGTSHENRVLCKRLARVAA